MRKKKVLVCGASGFIGRNVYEALSKRDDIELFGTCFGDRFSDDPRISDTDLTEKKNVFEATRGVDIIIHAAAVTSGMDAVEESPEKYISDNVMMNTLLSEAASRNGCSHFVFLSCTVMYPDSSKPLKENEIDLNNVHPAYFPFADLKVFAEKLCRFYSTRGRTRYTVLRPSSVYGPYDKFTPGKSHVLDSIIARVMSSKGEPISVWGAGNATRDFLHVYDLVRLVEAVIDADTLYQCEVFNAASGVSISILELAEMIVRISGKNLEVVCDTSKNSIDSTTSLDTTKALEYFRWKPVVDLDEGLGQTMEWYLKNSGGQIGR